MFQTAELTSLLRTIAIIVIVYYGFKVISRYLFPRFINWAGRKAQQKFQEELQRKFNNHQQNQNNYSQEKEGEVEISQKNDKSKPNKSSDFGEYVDFEEVE